MQKILIAVIAVLALLLFVMVRRGGSTSSAEAHELVKNGAVLVDVRTSAEFASGHLPGAVNIPVQELDRRWKELQPKDRPVVLYCRSGARSARAARMLVREGFASVHDIGPMSAW